MQTLFLIPATTALAADTIAVNIKVPYNKVILKAIEIGLKEIKRSPATFFSKPIETPKAPVKPAAVTPLAVQKPPTISKPALIPRPALRESFTKTIRPVPSFHYEPVQISSKRLTVKEKIAERLKRRQENLDAKVTLSIECPCGTVFEVSRHDFSNLKFAKEKTGKKPRCEKCGGNEKLLLEAGA
ncbi:hypothetical protein KW799_00125 [Candidatus Parcubacteria bacterium]|nr:hypothetical protein [Candidatus Parcubacteria bacterium]